MKFFVIIFALILFGCSHLSNFRISAYDDENNFNRNVAGEAGSSDSKPVKPNEPNSLQGVRVNPGEYSMAPEWELKIWVAGDMESALKPMHKKKFILKDPKQVALLKDAINLTLKIKKDFKESDVVRKDENDIDPYAPAMSKSGKRALDEALRLIDEIQFNGANETLDKKDALFHLFEVVEAYNLTFKYPVDRDHWILAAIPYASSQLGNYIATMPADRKAANLEVHSKKDDLSKVDPVDSSFWKNPVNISSRDLYYGFGRKQNITVDGACEYKKAKDSYGIHGGFKIDCRQKTYSVKFGSEVYSEPFNARVFWALGYPAQPVDFAKEIKVKYNRKLLTEYNRFRKSLYYRVTWLPRGEELIKYSIQTYLNPFKEAIKGVVLKDGKFMDVIDLRANLLKATAEKAEELDENYNTDFEKQIDAFVLRPTNIELDDPEGMDNIGLWDYNSLAHHDRREVRGMGLLAAFVGLYDNRFDNNKLRLTDGKAGPRQLIHAVSDLGSGLGKSSSVVFGYTNSDVNGYEWDFISAKNRLNPNDPERYRRNKYAYFYNYTSILGNLAFRMMNKDDARWMARKISEITEEQFKQMLIASGFSSAEVFLYVEKILYRRDQMIKVLGLADIPLLRPLKNKKVNYNPETDGAMTVFVDGKYISAPTEGTLKVKNGEVVSY